MSSRIRLNGEAVGWDDLNWDEREITEAERDAYEAQDYVVTTITGKLIAAKNIPFADGTIQLQPKSDFGGRVAAAGGHANYGYSGYFKAYVYLQGKRKALVDFWALFPNNEHHFAAQKDRKAVEAAIRQVIGGRAGTDVVKVARGYAFDPAAHQEREAALAARKSQG